MAITTRAGKGTPLTQAELDTNFTDLRDGIGARTPNDQSTTGIKVGVEGNDDFGWHDINGQLDTDPDDPNRAIWATWHNGIRALKFATPNAEAFTRFHIPHDYKIGTELFVHVHWDLHSDTATGGSVTWAIEYSYAKGFDQMAFPASKTVTVQQNVSLVKHQHMVAETPLTTPGGSLALTDTGLIEPDGLILARIYLDSNDVVESVADDPHPYVHFVDIHYQSTSVPTKNRQPDFWT